MKNWIDDAAQADEEFSQEELESAMEEFELTDEEVLMAMEEEEVLLEDLGDLEDQLDFLLNL